MKQPGKLHRVKRYYLLYLICILCIHLFFRSATKKFDKVLEINILKIEIVIVSSINYFDHNIIRIIDDCVLFFYIFSPVLFTL